MCPIKKPFILSFEFSQLVSLVLFFVFLLSLVKCSNQPGYAKWTNVFIPGPRNPKLDWESILPHSNNKNVSIPHRYTSTDLFEIPLPLGKKIGDYYAAIINNLDKNFKNRVYIEFQLKKLFQKSAFQVGIGGPRSPIEIGMSLRDLISLLCESFEFKNEKLERKKEGITSDIENFLTHIQSLFDSLLNYLISTDQPAFDVYVYLPAEMEITTFVDNCITKVNDAAIKSGSNTFSDAKIAAKLVLTQVLRDLSFSQEDGIECHKLSKIMTELKTYGISSEKLIKKGAFDKFENADFVFESNGYSKIYVIFPGLGDKNYLICDQLLLQEYFTRINESFEITGKNEIEIFSKLIAAALSTNLSPEEIFAPNYEPSKYYLFYAKTLGDYYSLEVSINEALKNYIDKRADAPSNSNSSAGNKKEKIPIDNSNPFFIKVGLGIVVGVAAFGLYWYFTK